ncbi:DUF1266 domain-containing protein [Aquimarina addita]|uniref:DUF1266 domain-containing protein n=1 Tax=Aquimarina addita TaxID=870485 RepID=A0ABP6UV30_9FLAO
MELLQNSPLHREYPVKKDSFLKAYQYLEPGVQILISIIGIVTIFFLLVIIMGVYEVVNMPRQDDGMSFQYLLETDFLFIIFGVCAALVFLYVFLNKQREVSVKEQLMYYELGNVYPLNTEQKMALRLNLVNVFYFGNWSETLEYMPTSIRLQGKKFKPKTFDIETEKLAQQLLNENWGILHKKHFYDMVGQLFDGMHSQFFASEMLSDVATNMISRLSGLIKKSEKYICNTNISSHNKPKQFIWGFDLWRVIPMSRDAFMAGYITEEEAWKEILRASGLIYYLFDSHEDFYNNYRLGNAYWSNDFKTTSERIDRWCYFDKHCDWPLRHLAWTRSEFIELPAIMESNFKEYLDQQKNINNNSIGFRK